MSNVEAWKTWEGRTVDGKFPLRQWLGGSDHSAVFVTERPGQSSLKAAIKLIAAPQGDAQVSRWRAAAHLSHPHLIRIYDSGRCPMDGTTVLYVVMELAEEDLSQILPQRALAPAEVADLLPPLLDTLSYLHGKGLVHGHIKPSNVLAVGDLLKLSADQVTPPAESCSEGTRRDVYDAPEVATGGVSQASDLWSVGATLVTALTQNEPAGEETSRGEPVLPAALPEPFRGIARECLRLDPKRRCSVADIKARLQPAARSVPVEHEPVPRPEPRKSRWPVAVGLLAVLLAVGVAVFHSRGKSGSAPSVTEQTAPQAEPPQTKAAPKPGPTASSATSPAPKTPVRKPDTPKPATGPQGEVVHQVLPEIPQSAKNTITGTIKIAVRVDVDPSGKVTAAKLTSAGPSKYFANLVLQAARGWEFSAPEENGQPAASAWNLRFRLKRSGTQVTPERVSH